MKRFIQAAMSFLLFGMIAGIAATVLQKSVGVPVWATCCALLAIVLVRAYASMRKFNKWYSNDRYKQFMPGNQVRIYRADVQVEIWAKFIMGAIFRNNAFLQYAFNADDNVLSGKVVHIPQAGGTAGVQKNRSSLPANVTKRTDTDITYALDEFTTDPRLIPYADTVELSYDKMNSVMTDDMNALRQTVAENMLINWAPATNIIRTTGGAIATHLTGTLGSRRKFISDDLMAAQLYLDNQDMPTEGRYALISANMHNQLVKGLSESEYRDYSRALDPATGVVGQLWGFKILVRSRVLVYDNTPEVKAYGAVAADTDNDAVLCWHQDAVERAMGEIKVFNRDNDPQYYGDLMSFLMRMGGRIRREDEKGVVAIVQDAA